MVHDEIRIEFRDSIQIGIRKVIQCQTNDRIQQSSSAEMALNTDV